MNPKPTDGVRRSAKMQRQVREFADSLVRVLEERDEAVARAEALQRELDTIRQLHCLVFKEALHGRSAELGALQSCSKCKQVSSDIDTLLKNVKPLSELCEKTLQFAACLPGQEALLGAVEQMRRVRSRHEERQKTLELIDSNDSEQKEEKTDMESPVLVKSEEVAAMDNVWNDHPSREGVKDVWGVFSDNILEGRDLSAEETRVDPALARRAQKSMDAQEGPDIPRLESTLPESGEERKRGRNPEFPSEIMEPRRNHDGRPHKMGRRPKNSYTIPCRQFNTNRRGCKHPARTCCYGHFCQKCLSFTHPSMRCPSVEDPPKVLHQNICRDFNRDGCFSDRCRDVHICSLCHSTDHNMKQCTRS